MNEYVHYIKAGDGESARKHRLTLLAECGAVYVPHRRGVLSDLPSCPDCEEISGPIQRRGLGRAHFVYRCYDADEVLLYVGCTGDLRTRRLAHSKNSWWYGQMVSHRVTVYPDRETALRVEQGAILLEQPLWNVRHQNFQTWAPDQIRLAQQIATELDAPAPVASRFSRLAAVA